jgi:contact-dependent growth inhibition (CDI) system CdiI-like immunity protein
MKALNASDFPELRRAFTGYLHEDFLEEYETPADALRAFQDDAGEDEARRFRREARRFLDRTAAVDFQAVRALISRLGCRWTPPSRKAFTAMLTDAIAPPRTPDV